MRSGSNLARPPLTFSMNWAMACACRQITPSLAYPLSRVLRLRRDQSEARHLPRAADHGVVVGVYDADAEARDAQVLGEAVGDVNQIPVAVGIVLDHLGDAHVTRLVEDGSGERPRRTPSASFSR
ncbi:hypothetical protein C4D60_Mb04t36050 [Musa balbisiana]|uniref:Uncharacterized protein n=1 Tax=Musa balbisiana TaxID=52838 RepID=A0A4S8KH49_MUSBA|nr:hypothetical protein C4D60_Mb04t36050 [Musa balbisiana]